MKEKIVGLHIGESHITAAEVHRHGEGLPKIHRVGWAAHDPLAAPAETVRVIRHLWKESRIKTYALCTCLNSRSLILKHFDYPPLSDDELQSALRLEAEEALQLPAESISLDWHLDSRGNGTPRPPHKNHQGILVAAPRKDVDAHLEVVRAARLYPILMDVRCMAVANLLLTVRPPAEGESLCLLHIAPSSADMCIIYERTSMYPRTFFSRSATWEESATYLLGSIKDNLKYYQFSMRKPPVTRIVLTGHIIDPEPFIKKVESSFGLPVEAWNPVKDFRMHRSVQDRLSNNEHMGQALAACLGLAIRQAT